MGGSVLDNTRIKTFAIANVRAVATPTSTMGFIDPFPGRTMIITPKNPIIVADQRRLLTISETKNTAITVVKRGFEKKIAVASAKGMLITVTKTPNWASIASSILKIWRPIFWVFSFSRPILIKIGVSITIPIPYLKKASSSGSNLRPRSFTITSVMENKNVPILSQTIPRTLPGSFSQVLEKRSDFWRKLTNFV